MTGVSVPAHLPGFRPLNASLRCYRGCRQSVLPIPASFKRRWHAVSVGMESTASPKTPKQWHTCSTPTTPSESFESSLFLPSNHPRCAIAWPLWGKQCPQPESSFDSCCVNSTASPRTPKQWHTCGFPLRHWSLVGHSSFLTGSRGGQPLRELVPCWQRQTWAPIGPSLVAKSARASNESLTTTHSRRSTWSVGYCPRF